MKDFTDNLIESYTNKSKTTISEAVNLNPMANDPDEMPLQFELDDYDEDGNLKDISAWDSASAAYHAGDAKTWKDELIKMERDPNQINVHDGNPHYQPKPMTHEDELDAAEVSMKKYQVQKAKEIEKQNAERNLFNYIDSNTMNESYEDDENSNAWTDEDLAEALFKSLYESKLREDATVLTEANPKIDSRNNKFVVEDGEGNRLNDSLTSYKQAKVELINQSTANRDKNIYLVGIAGNSEFELARAKNGTIMDENKKELKRFETAVKTNSNSAALSTSRAQTAKARTEAQRQQVIDNNKTKVLNMLKKNNILSENDLGKLEINSNVSDETLKELLNKIIKNDPSLDYFDETKFDEWSSELLDLVKKQLNNNEQARSKETANNDLNNKLAEKQTNIINSLLEKNIIENTGFGYQISSKFAKAFNDSDEDFNQFKQIIDELSDDEKKLTAEQLKTFIPSCRNLVNKYKEYIENKTQADEDENNNKKKSEEQNKKNFDQLVTYFKNCFKYDGVTGKYDIDPELKDKLSFDELTFLNKVNENNYDSGLDYFGLYEGNKDAGIINSIDQKRGKNKENANSQNEEINEEAAQDLSKLAKAFSDKEVNQKINSAVKADLGKDELGNLTKELAGTIVTKAGLDQKRKRKGTLIGATKQLINAIIDQNTDTPKK